jgi:hypothetical protein
LSAHLAEVLRVGLARPWIQKVIPVRPEVETTPPDELPIALLLPLHPCQLAELVQLLLKLQALLRRRAIYAVKHACGQFVEGVT